MPEVRALLASFRFFAIVGLLAVSASAGIITYSGYDSGAGSVGPWPNSDAAAASFDAANPGLPIITFESAPSGWFYNLTVATGVSLFAMDTDGWMQNIRNIPWGALVGYNTTSGGSQWLSMLGGWATFTFASPINAFGVYLSGVECCFESFTFNDGAPQSIDIVNLGGGNGGLQFLGFSDTSPFSSITINGIYDRIGVDDVRYGYTESPAPEPATLGLLGAALAGLGFLRRRLC